MNPSDAGEPPRPEPYVLANGHLTTCRMNTVGYIYGVPMDEWECDPRCPTWPHNRAAPLPSSGEPEGREVLRERVAEALFNVRRDTLIADPDLRFMPRTWEGEQEIVRDEWRARAASLLVPAPSEGRSEPRIAEAIAAWDEVCDLDYRCPDAGRWPRTYGEAGDWAFRHGHAVVEYLRLCLATPPASPEAPDPFDARQIAEREAAVERGEITPAAEAFGRMRTPRRGGEHGE